MEKENNTQNSEKKLSEEFESFFNSFSDDLDKKFLEIETALDEKKSSIFEAAKNELKEVQTVGDKLKKLENVVSGGEKKTTEDLNNYKNAAQEYITKCENLDNYMCILKEAEIEDLVKITKKGFAIEKNKLPILKNIKNANLGTLFKWKSQSQQKKPCQVSEEDTKLKIIYESCWNDFHSLPLQPGENEIYLEILCENVSSPSHFTIGVTNQRFSGTDYCIGCQNSPDSFVLKLDGIIKLGSNALPKNNNFASGNGIYHLCLVVDTEKKDLTFKNKLGQSAGPYQISGDEFKVSVGTCSGGICTYKFLESFD
jgi:hypothetical protein